MILITIGRAQHPMLKNIQTFSRNKLMIQYLGLISAQHLVETLEDNIIQAFHIEDQITKIKTVLRSPKKVTESIEKRDLAC